MKVNSNAWLSSILFFYALLGLVLWPTQGLQVLHFMGGSKNLAPMVLCVACFKAGNLRLVDVGFDAQNTC